MLSRPLPDGRSELLAAILIAKTDNDIFFFSSRYNNLSAARLKETINLALPADKNPNQKWFTQFAFPDLSVFKPKGYHQIANFVVNRDYRRQGIAKFFLANILKYYVPRLISGRGFWQLADPPWLEKMQPLGFYLRAGAESFFIDQEWNRLPPNFLNAQQLSNVEYNAAFGLPNIYANWQPTIGREDLRQRLEEVGRLAVAENAKLQYFQLLFNLP